jgi:hypothetical protein
MLASSPSPHLESQFDPAGNPSRFELQELRSRHQLGDPMGPARTGDGQRRGEADGRGPSLSFDGRA